MTTDRDPEDDWGLGLTFAQRKAWKRLEKIAAAGGHTAELGLLEHLADRLEAVERLVDGWGRAYGTDLFAEPPERPEDAKLAWVQGETPQVVSRTFSVDLMSAAMGRHMANALHRAIGRKQPYNIEGGTG